MKSITAAITVSLLAMDWWDRTYNHAAYGRAIEAIMASIKHSTGF